MRIGENPYLNSVSNPLGKSPYRNAAPLNTAPFQPQLEKTGPSFFASEGVSLESADYAVKISEEAKKAFTASYALGNQEKTDAAADGENEVQGGDPLLQVLEEARSTPKTRLERLKEMRKEQEEKLKKLSAEEMRIATDDKLSEKTKRSRVSALNTQMQEVMKTIGEIDKQIAEEEDKSDPTQQMLT